MSAGPPLGAGREFDLIRTILAEETAGDAPPRGEVLAVGPGDDAAVLAGPGRVLTTDLAVEGIHFRRGWLSAEEVGYRAAMAALSDLAAMGAAPVAILVSLAGPPADAASGYLAEVGRGARRAAGAVGAVLAGGDVTRSPGPVVVDVVAVGETDAPVLRRGARPGDGVWVTGTLGAAAGAVRCWEEGRTPPDALRDRYAAPEPRFQVLPRLRETGLLSAGMDLSDGLLGDAGHLAAASGVALRLEEARIPVHEALAAAVGAGEARRLAASGGEDYEILFTAGAGLEALRGELEAELGLPLTRVGGVEEGEGVHLLDREGRPLTPAERGFDHFREGR